VLVALCQKVTRHKRVVGEMKQRATHNGELELVEGQAHLAPVTRCGGGVRRHGGGGSSSSGRRARVKVLDT